MDLSLARPAAAPGVALPTAPIATAGGQDAGDASPVFDVRLPAGYREWLVVGDAHEAGSLNDTRVSWLTRWSERLSD